MTIQIALTAALILVSNVARAADAPIPAGAPAPAFNLRDQNGTTHRIPVPGKTTVLAFYPADATPGCTKEARSITDSLKSFQKRGVQVFGVSVQDIASKKAFCEKEGITYPLLADVGGVAAAAYGVYDAGRGVAKRATFIIRPDGAVQALIANVATASHGPDVVALLDQMAPSTPDLVKPAAPTSGRPFPLAPEAGETAPGIKLPIAFRPPGDAAVATSVASPTNAPTVVLFISTRCPVSNAYNARMSAVAADYTPKGVAFIAVNSNAAETPDEIARHAAKNRFGFAVLKDAGNKVADAYGAMVTPEAVLLDARGRVVYRGRLDEDMNQPGLKAKDLRAALDAALAGKPAPKPALSAFGCTIKREKPVTF